MLDIGIITHRRKCIGLALACVLVRSSQFNHGINKGEGELAKTEETNYLGL